MNVEIEDSSESIPTLIHQTVSNCDEFYATTARLYCPRESEQFQSLLCYDHANVALCKTWSIVSWHIPAFSVFLSVVVYTACPLVCLEFYEMQSQEQIGITRSARKKEEEKKENENCTTSILMSGGVCKSLKHRRSLHYSTSHSFWCLWSNLYHEE